MKWKTKSERFMFSFSCEHRCCCHHFHVVSLSFVSLFIPCELCCMCARVRTFFPYFTEWVQLYSMVIGFFIYSSDYFFRSVCALLATWVKCANQEINRTSFTDKMNKCKREKKRVKRKTKDVKRKGKKTTTHDDIMWKRLLNLCHCIHASFYLACICNSVFILIMH